MKGARSDDRGRPVLVDCNEGRALSLVFTERFRGGRSYIIPNEYLRMDVFMAVLILLAGIIPPVATGYWAYRMGKKGSKEALALRDEAVGQVNALHKELSELEARLLKAFPKVPTTEEIVEAMPEPDYTAVTDEIKEAILRSIDGKWGNMTKDFTSLKEKIDKALEAGGSSPTPGGALDDRLLLKMMDKFI